LRPEILKFFDHKVINLFDIPKELNVMRRDKAIEIIITINGHVDMNHAQIWRVQV
jgi:hypothetical protein